DWNRADPLMRFVDLRDVVVGLAADRQVWEEDGCRVLARTSDLTPVVRVRQDAGGTTVQLAFHPAQSYVVLRPAFPALIANLMGGLDATVRVRLGEPLPGGTEAVLQPGLYQVEGAAGASEAVYASLLAPEESRLPESSVGSQTAEQLGAVTGAAAGPSDAADSSHPDQLAN